MFLEKIDTLSLSLWRPNQS